MCSVLAVIWLLWLVFLFLRWLVFVCSIFLLWGCMFLWMGLIVMFSPVGSLSVICMLLRCLVRCWLLLWCRLCIVLFCGVCCVMFGLLVCLLMVGTVIEQLHLVVCWVTVCVSWSTSIRLAVVVEVGCVCA